MLAVTWQFARTWSLTMVVVAAVAVAVALMVGGGADGSSAAAAMSLTPGMDDGSRLDDTPWD